MIKKYILLLIAPCFIMTMENNNYNLQVPVAPNIIGFYNEEIVRLDKRLAPLKTKISYHDEFDLFLREHFSETSLAKTLKMQMFLELNNFEAQKISVQLRAVNSLINVFNQRELSTDDLQVLKRNLLDCNQRINQLNITYDYVTRREFLNYLTPARLIPMIKNAK